MRSRMLRLASVLLLVRLASPTRSAGAQAPTRTPAAAAGASSAAQPTRGTAAARFAGTDSALEARTREVAAQLRCPVCQGLSLQDSPSELAQEMRGVVREQLRAGRTPGEVRQYFINRYGEWILMEPQAHGFNWLVYVLPALVLIGGLAVIYVALRRWTAGALSAVATPVAHSTATSQDAPAPDGSE